MLTTYSFQLPVTNSIRSMPPVQERLREINDKINTVDGTESAGVKRFSELMPNTNDSQPVKLLSPKVLIDLIKTNARKYGVDAKLINAIIKNESGYNLNAKSPAGATGLMQLMPDTARSLGVTDIKDPAQNVEAGTKYFSSLLGKYRGNVILALAAYNAGPAAVDKYGTVPPYKETNQYIRNVLTTYLGNSTHA
jgi:soluble lytic murein transglycosylase-like protein